MARSNREGLLVGLSVDSTDKVDERGELVETVMVVCGLEGDTERVDTGVAVETEPFDDAFVVPDEIGIEAGGEVTQLNNDSFGFVALTALGLGVRSHFTEKSRPAREIAGGSTR